METNCTFVMTGTNNNFKLFNWKVLHAWKYVTKKYQIHNFQELHKKNVIPKSTIGIDGLNTISLSTRIMSFRYRPCHD